MSGWAAAVQAGLELADTGISIWSADRANKQNRAMQRHQMEFSKHMFRNRYKYTMEDMKNSGLNPILAYSQGGGSPPQGSIGHSAQSVAPGGAGLSKAWQSTMTRRMAEQELKNKQATYDLIRSQKFDTDMSYNKKMAERNGQWITNKLLELSTNSARMNATVAKQMDEIYKANPWLKGLDLFSKSVQGAGQAGSSVSPILKHAK